MGMPRPIGEDTRLVLLPFQSTVKRPQSWTRSCSWITAMYRPLK
ncbi:hypothetical protein KW848_29630 [Pseudomonas sp. PDM25]|nr:hypothetical protein [Pseudomonas sp. PDM25]